MWGQRYLINGFGGKKIGVERGKLKTESGKWKEERGKFYLKGGWVGTKGGWRLCVGKAEGEKRLRPIGARDTQRERETRATREKRAGVP